MIQLKDYFGRWEKHVEVTDKVIKNASTLISKVSELCSVVGIVPVITSGFRPHAYNAQIGGAKNSAHTTGEAIDIADPEKKIAAFCLHTPEFLVERGLYIETPVVTCASHLPEKRWVHFQIRRPKSGSTIFLPIIILCVSTLFY